MTSPSPLRAAVIGLGRMGQHHARACADSADVDLAAICESDESVLRALASDFECRAVQSVTDLIGEIDMAVIAVPTQLHAGVAIPLLRAGVACLIEKPIAVSESDAQAIIAAAADGGATLRVGHIERFNPAITALRQVLPSDLTATTVTAERCNPAQARNYDTDAILDLMIHDIDLIGFLGVRDGADGSPTIAVKDTASFHTTHAAVTFADGVTATFKVDREATAPRRTLTVSSSDIVYSINFSTRSVTVTRDGAESAVPVTETDALRAQLRSFIAAAKGVESDTTDGEAALSALRLANAVRHHAGLTP